MWQKIPRRGCSCKITTACENDFAPKLYNSIRKENDLFDLKRLICCYWKTADEYIEWRIRATGLKVNWWLAGWAKYVHRFNSERITKFWQEQGWIRESENISTKIKFETEDSKPTTQGQLDKWRVEYRSVELFKRGWPFSRKQSAEY